MHFCIGIDLTSVYLYTDSLFKTGLVCLVNFYPALSKSYFIFALGLAGLVRGIIVFNLFLKNQFRFLKNLLYLQVYVCNYPSSCSNNL